MPVAARATVRRVVASIPTWKIAGRPQTFGITTTRLFGALERLPEKTVASLAQARATQQPTTGNGSTTPYIIRLPKNARSFRIQQGASGTKSAAQPLYVSGTQTLTLTDSTTVSVTDFHHAGTTFNVSTDATPAVGIVSLRSGYTESKSTEITDPLNPRSDGDYIFFTDTDGFANGGKVYAYFYGAEDGEFVAWPGNVAQTNSNQLTTYTDNNGDTVYMFRVPQSRNGKYSYVIFNDGVTTNARQIRQAAPLTAGKNYVLDTTAANQKAYGTVTTTAYAVDVQDKALTESATYGSANKYIYIINNGTNNFGLVNGEARHTFDEMHVVFYDMYHHVIGAESGYIPDRLGSGSTWAVTKDANNNEIYRIVVPESAKYFQITNGVNKGLDANDEDTHLKERYSEIAEIADNGLYQFVTAADLIAAGKTNTDENYIEGTSVPTAEDNLYTPKYLLTLVNPLKVDIPETIIRDVKLATVVTGDDGKPKYIKWLRQQPVEGKEYNPNDPTTYHSGTVDTEYLANDPSDVYDPATGSPLVKKVKVKKTGTYYWKESAAPSGYDVNTDEHLMFVEDDGVYFYDENNNRVKVDVEHDVNLTIVNEPTKNQSEIILTKTAKEKVGTTDIGDALAGAEFKLVKIVDASTTDETLRFTLVTEDNTNKYTLGGNTSPYNQTNAWLTTGTDGKLHIKNLPAGDYYLEEMKAPQGYSNKDASGANRKVYFSVGDNTKTKEITFADEMEPAYIRLFEHISEKRDEWGDPTFVFKIKQTQYYTWMPSETEGQPNEWKLNGTDTNGKEILVALTVNDDGTITDSYGKVLKWVDRSEEDPDNKNKFFTADPIDNELYGNWLVEATSEDEYNGLFRIDEQGRIRVEPGKYEITRLPVSRYEFVTSGHIVYTTDPTTDPYEDSNTFEHDDSQKVTINALAGGQTADVHYYDKVGYYDKFTQVDEEINSFHRYTDTDDNTVKKSVKGIRIADYKQKGTGDNGDTNDSGVMTVNVADLTIYKIMSDGSEVAMTPAEKSAIDADDISVTYTYAENDDKKFGGDSTATPAVPAQFSYANKTITVTDAGTFLKGVYTLEANYKGFKSKFDIVFLREAPTP